MSSYKNAADILPAGLLEALQQYAAGMQIYIPRPEERVRWGERSGTRQALAARNEEIRRRYCSGASIDELMDSYHLSYDSIRKIISQKNRAACSGL